jgi:prepilin-type processing-associated H-X9-DG protein
MNNWMGGNAYSQQYEYKVFQRLDDITRPEPAKAMVLLEEREDSINDSAFYVNMNGALADYPANRHDGGSVLAYADGHAGYRLWQDSRTVSAPVPPGETIPLELSPSGNVDVDFLRSVATAPR